MFGRKKYDSECQGRYTGEAVNNVRRTRGKIKLEDIAKGWYNGE